MKDIECRDDIVNIIGLFYEDIMVDEKIKHFFLEVVDLTDKEVLDHHLNTIVNFWASMLLGDMSYFGNAMMPHLKMHKISPLMKVHFETWLMHLTKRIDEFHEGPIAETMKTRALSIATVMEIKVHGMA